MKWRKMLELSTSSSPPGRRSPVGRTVKRRVAFEALENRRLFAIDLAEITTADLFSGDFAPIEDISIETMELTSVKFDETAEVIIDPAPLEFDGLLEYPEIMMMTFRGHDAVEPTAVDKAVETDVALELDYFMTLSSDATEVTEVDETVLRVLETDLDLSATSVLVDDTIVIDDAIADGVSEEDLIRYTLSPGPEVETTSFEEPLTLEDVNGDGNVTPLDMLLVVNVLNGYGFQTESLSYEAAETTSGNWDINRDGHLTPMDVLLLTNYFNYGASVETVESSLDPLATMETFRIGDPTEDEPFDEAAPLVDEELAWS